MTDQDKRDADNATTARMSIDERQKLPSSYFLKIWTKVGEGAIISRDVRCSKGAL